MAAGTVDKMELLAPAGTIEAYEAAVAAGADAVYVGAPACNARALARPFRVDEITAMAGHAQARGVKLFVAMNSLLREEEIPQAVSLLATLAEIKIDGLIIQDLGIYQLARRYFPELRLHASTLMAAHNSPAVRQLAGLGYERVVLARELTLAEIAMIHRETGVELEVFVHGAMCFSVSGLCLFSSYLGGKSGLRGRCVQPCRRRYTWAGPGRESGGYLFSMNDLSSIELLPELREAGVVSIKIEGRMRSAHYVGRVVKAYRTVLDSPANDPAALAAARGLLAEAMGRRATSGFFLSATPRDIISPHYSGNIGVFLGKITGARGSRANLTLRAALRTGDRLRLHQEKTGEREGFSLRKMLVNDRPVAAAAAGVEVAIELPVAAASGDSLYLVDPGEAREKWMAKGPGPRQLRIKVDQRRIAARSAGILAEIERGPDRAGIRESGTKPRTRQTRGSGGRGLPLAWWLKVDDLRLLALHLPVQPERLVVLLRRETLGQAMRMRKELARRRHSLIWALPPVIFPTDIEFYQQAVAALLAWGYRDWLIAHVGQVALLADGLASAGNATVTAAREERPRRSAPGKGGGRPGRVLSPGDLTLHGDYTLNILNSRGLGVLASLGITSTVLGIETDRELLGRILAHKGASLCGLPVYGLPALFTARAAPEHFQYDRLFVSPRQEKFGLLQRGQLTVAVPSAPFSLLPFMPDLAAAGLDFAVIDLSYMQKRKADLEALVVDLARPHKPPATGTFNFRGKLL